MRNLSVFPTAFGISLIALALLAHPATAGENPQDDQLAHGRYIATIAGCTSCHTPYRAEFQNPQKLTLEQIQTIAFNDSEAIDAEKFMAGGRAFPLGPAGTVFTLNITPDEDTGLGKWTDEQIKIAIKTGTDRNGKVLFPVMPYHVYNGMADLDLEAVIAFLRSVKAVSNTPPKKTVSTEGLPTPPFTTGIIAPDASDPAARGAYLVNNVMGCTDCHTPIDPANGAPMMDKYLSGGQPYEGPWGIVYGGNITPDRKTGIGDWNDEEVKRALVSGIGNKGRRLILMPWFVYSTLTREDADAVVYFLKNGLPAISNQVPAASLNPEFNVTVQNPDDQNIKPGFSFTSPIVLVIVGLVVIALVTIGMRMIIRRTG